MLSKVKKVFSNKSRKFSNSKSNENCKTSSVVSVTTSLPDFSREFSTLTEECGYVPTVLVNASKIIEAHVADKYLFQTQGSVGKVDYLIQILGRDRLSVPRNINIHDVVEAVKVYLNRKATSIVPDEIMTKLIENHNNGSTEEDIRIISQYRKMLPDVVPSVHYVLLLMNKVSKYSHINGMDERKLATIFVLDILKPLSISETHENFEKNRLERVQRLPYNIMVVEHLIRNVHIFEFAPYQQIHEPFVSPSDDGAETTKKKEIEKAKCLKDDDNGLKLPGRLRDEQQIPMANAPTTPPKTSTKHPQISQIAKSVPRVEVTPSNYTMRSSDTSENTNGNLDQSPSVQKRTRESPGDVGKQDNSKRIFRASFSASPSHSPYGLKRENIDSMGRLIRTDKYESKMSKDKPDVGKENYGIRKDISGIRKENSGNKKETSSLGTRKDIWGIRKGNSGVKKDNLWISDKKLLTSTATTTGVLQQALSYSASNKLKEPSLTHVQRGLNGLPNPLNSPSRLKRPQEKLKKTANGPSYSVNHRYSLNRYSPRTSAEAGFAKRPIFSGSAISKYAKRGRLKEPKKKMFRKDEELQPWDGWITESEDISLIVRTTKNPKTFQFLEKYFMALDPDRSIEKIVFDASTPGQTEQQTQGKKKARRMKNKISPCSRYKGKCGTSTETVRSVSHWPSRKACEKRISRLDTINSSPELSAVDVGNPSPDRCNVKEQSKRRTSVSPVQNEKSPQRNTGKNHVCTSTNIDTNGGLKVECKNSFAWECGGDSTMASINRGKEPKERGGNNKKDDMLHNIFDWVIDVSLIGIALFCATYIYNVI